MEKKTILGNYSSFQKFPLGCEGMDYLQSLVLHSAAICLLSGFDCLVLSGCTVSGGIRGEGYVFIRESGSLTGEIFYHPQQSAKNKCRIKSEDFGIIANGESFNGAYTVRSIEDTNSGTFPWTSFVFASDISNAVLRSNFADIKQRLDAEVTARENAVSDEVTARDNAVSAAVSSAVSAETAARKTAVAAETAARKTAVADEAAARERLATEVSDLDGVLTDITSGLAVRTFSFTKTGTATVYVDIEKIPGKMAIVSISLVLSTDTEGAYKFLIKDYTKVLVDDSGFWSGNRTVSFCVMANDTRGIEVRVIGNTGGTGEFAMTKWTLTANVKYI